MKSTPTKFFHSRKIILFSLLSNLDVRWPPWCCVKKGKLIAVRGDQQCVKNIYRYIITSQPWRVFVDGLIISCFRRWLRLQKPKSFTGLHNLLNWKFEKPHRLKRFITCTLLAHCSTSTTQVFKEPESPVCFIANTFLELTVELFNLFAT